MAAKKQLEKLKNEKKKIDEETDIETGKVRSLTEIIDSKTTKKEKRNKAK